MTGVTLLWALRSPCNLGCLYCYFGTIEEHRETPPDQVGVLSHLARTDLTLADIAAFVDTLAGSRVERVFLAGGEPLIWPPIMDVVAAIKGAGVEVVLCTNGIPLNRPNLVDRILTLGVDAVSVSLDSTDAGYNDTWRPARNRVDGHASVLSGVRALLTARGAAATPRVGLYAVITRQNTDDILSVGALAAELGCDYYVPQPISLELDHPLHTELALTDQDAPAIARRLAELYEQVPIGLPAPTYPRQFLDTISTETPGTVTGCFGGTDLFFVEPDGSVWDCPSGLKIRATPPDRHRNIRGTTAEALFGRGGACADCSLYSRDCVNMWPLTDFQRFLPSAGVRS
ncbi:heme b synthase [Actinoplanes sichuanensis]|uniref:Radical SAM protein n=1 Tax=Actinoplanes sichuanensis TaxID=512349 RepID=A0ABW4A246_9ACTN|nr:radical SAM protein [Actinoplanes sichuanensis]BEL12965.1 heme b synthase [Actinoplanes sichuanensis]